MAFRDTLTAVRFLTEADPYHYTIDNRPSSDLAARDIILANAIESLPGFGQTLQDVKASRALGTPYTNDTIRPIRVSVSGSSTGNFPLTATVAGIPMAISQTSIGLNTSVFFEVQPGQTYLVTLPSGTISVWVEIR